MRRVIFGDGSSFFSPLLELLMPLALVWLCRGKSFSL
jgi:hypothetical protein